MNDDTGAAKKERWPIFWVHGVQFFPIPAKPSDSEVWLQIYCSAIGAMGVDRQVAMEIADFALKEFRKRFREGEK